MKGEFKKIKQINETGNIDVIHTHQNPQKFPQKSPQKIKNGQRKKKNINIESNIIPRRHNENFVKLPRKTEESVGYTSDPERTLVHLIRFFFQKSQYKRLNKNLNFKPTPKVYYKNELDNNLNNFLRLIKLEAHFKDSINNDTDDKNIMFKENKNKDWTPSKNHHTIDIFFEALKKDIKSTKTFKTKQLHQNFDKG